MKDLYILDALSFLFRSYYAIRQMTNEGGESTNALYGFIRSVQKIVKDFSPSHLVVVFDGPDNKQARTKIYPEYKANRTGMPEDLVRQLALAMDYCKYAGIPYLVEPNVEADDLIGTISKWAENKGTHIYICSNDKDLCQLISDKVVMINTHKDNLVTDSKKVKEIYGIKPKQMVDYLAIMGDKSDNIPGIPGFGPKTAASLLEEYETLNNLLKQLPTMKNRKQAEKIEKNRNQVLVSKQLAQLILDVSFPKKTSFFELNNPNTEKLTQLFHSMNFLTLLKEMQQKSSLATTTPSKQKDLNKDSVRLSYKVIDSTEELHSLIHMLKTKKVLCIDTETTSIDPMEAKLVGIGFGIEPGSAWYIPTNGSLGLTKVLAAIKPLLEKETIAFYGHNIKYDIHVLKNHGITIERICFDTLLASYLLAPQKGRHSLDELSLEKFGTVKTPIKDLIGQGKSQKSMLDVPIETVGNYCCEDVDYTCRLKNLLEKEIGKHHLEAILYEIEIPLISVLVSMERYGMYVDKKQLRTMSTEFAHRIKKIELEIYTLAKEEFNIKSPKQLAYILFDKLAIKTSSKKKSTRADILESLQHDYPIVKKVLEFRKFEKLLSTYVNALNDQINPNTSRIHCSFMQSVTATGRLSCQNPNLQNIPIKTNEGKKIREAFKPDQIEWCYLSADYSQIELRLLAHFSKDPTLIAAFKNHEDIHTSTAATIFNVPISQVTKAMRSQAKAVNFGIVYGQQAFGLSQILGIEVKKASEFIEKYFEKYPYVKDFLNTCKSEVRQSGIAFTMNGRQRPIPEINNPNRMIRQAAERLAVNTPLQGTQADIIKKAMIEIAYALKKNCLGHMVLQIHDELIFELPKKNVAQMEKVVGPIMENIIDLTVPLTVNIGIGKNWGEC